MAPNWGPTPNRRHHQQGPPNQPNQPLGPLPICFKCGCEGHFVVDCPQRGPSNSLSHNQTGSHALDPNQANRAGGANGGVPAPVPHEAQWPNNQNGAAAGLYQHPKPAPVATPYQQYPGPVPGPHPQAQYYPLSQQGPYQPPQTQQYGQYEAPYGYNQPLQQAYNAPPPNPQFSNQGYNQQPHGQYPQPNGYSQPGYPAYQNPSQPYAPPHAGSTPYPPQGGQYAPPQWNYSQPAPYNAAHFQQPDNNTGVRRSTPGYSRGSFQAQQSPQTNQITPQTPHSTSNPTHYSPLSVRQGSVASNARVSSTGEQFDSNNEFSRANSGGAANHRSISSNSHQWRTGDTVTTSGNGKMHRTARENEGEVPDNNSGDEEFRWELEKIFKESPPTENVVLAQPLSTTFDMTPVPLIHAGAPPSVSRYARRDNLKEFVRPIRNQPQWSYLQEDPAFSDAKMQGELIPLRDIPIWMARRQGVDPQSLATRKRVRPNKDRQPATENGVNFESFAKPVNRDFHPDQQEVEVVDKHMRDVSTVEAPGTAAATPGTPTFDRTGTPSLDTEDDVWAPQPGEGAPSAPTNVDPTEALLASLGVTGSPKPVRKRSVPELSISTDEGSARKRPKIMPSQESSGYSESQSRHSQHVYGAQNEQPIAYEDHLQGKPHNEGFQNNHHYGTHHQNSYGNGVSPQNASPYSVSPHSQYPCGPQYRNAPHGLQQHGSYDNSQHGLPPQNRGPPQFHDPWTASRKGNPHGQQQHLMLHNGHTAASQAPHGNGYGKPTHNTIPSGKSSHAPFKSTEGSQLSRHSGRTNSRDSHHKDSSNMVQQARSSQKQFDGGADDISTPAVKTPVLSECRNSKASDTNEPDESPLTPTSAEILGKLTQPASKDSDDTARRLRRPQPVIAEAYSRRW